MIDKYVFGVPMETDATVRQIEATTDVLPYFEVSMDKGLTFSFDLDEDDQVFGLGENVRGIDKRGYTYISWCNDDNVHTENKRSLYGAHNFLIVSGHDTFGAFFDSPAKVTFDVGDTDPDRLTVRTEDPNMNVYIVEADSLTGIVRAFRDLIGRSYIPPKWAFGYQQSRWSYMTSAEVRQVAKQYRQSGIPLDAIYLDIDYMERYKDFTVNRVSFGDFEEMAADLKAQGIRLVPIIDAGVKIEKGYRVYEEGVEKGYFCKDESGKDFVAAVWPGRCHFPDVLNPEARAWFGSQYKVLLDMGVEGFWNDMNEPAIFFTDEGLTAAYETAERLKDSEMTISEFDELKGAFGHLSQNIADYKRFYHNVNGKMIRHDKVNNLFGFNMTRAAGEAFERIEPDKRILLFSRSSYIGMHRYGGIWQGDNDSWWSHLLLNLKMMPSLNMCGFLYTGADVGGFQSDVTEDLMKRWLQLAVFTPLMRNHAAMGTRRQELYAFKHKKDMANIVGIRYALLPYLYSEYMKAALEGGMMFRPLAFDYPNDPVAARVEDQLMLGNEAMIAPVYEQNARGRYVYLPEDMLLVRLRGAKDCEMIPMEKGHHYIELSINQLALFIRKGRVIPVSAKPGMTVEQTDFDNLVLWGMPGAEAEYTLYDDDGLSRDYENPANITRIAVKGGRASVTGDRKTADASKLVLG